MATIDEDAVRARAYQLWEEGGCAHGSHEDHWRRAEAECGAAGGDAAGGRDTVGPTTLSGTDAEGAVILSGPGGDVSPSDAAAAPPGIEGEISRPLIDVKPKPRRWPTPIIDN